MAVLWCRIVLRLEVEVIGEEHGGVLKNGIAAIGGCRGLVDEELMDGIEGRCELCDQLWSDCGVVRCLSSIALEFCVSGGNEKRSRQKIRGSP